MRGQKFEVFAQAMLEKGALDGISASMAQFGHRVVEFAQDEKALLTIAVVVVVVLFWRLRR